MSPLSLFPHLGGFRLLELTSHTHLLSLTLARTSPHARCPLCRKSARRVHSRYSRRVADLPLGCRRVCLRFRVRRFFCDTSDCPRRIFAERFPGLVAPYARRSQVLHQALEQIGFALGGRPGARLTEPLGMPASASTLLRRIRAAPEPVIPAPRVLGVDDWALRKGHTYGTLLVDLERSRPVELLPDRQAETLTKWLKEHPGVEIISRDRAGAYAEGARQGAPNALQVADRWHLLKNLGDGLERFLQRHHRLVQAAAAATALPDKELEPVAATAALGTPASDGPASSPDAATEPCLAPVPTCSPAGTEFGRPQTRKQRLHEEAHRLFRQGCAHSEIARLLQLDRKTVRRYLRLEAMPERQTRTKRGSLVDEHMGFIQKRWEEGCHNAHQIFRELRARGFPGGRTIVKERITRLRREHRSVPPSSGVPAKAVAAKVSIRQVVWNFVRPPEALKEAERVYLGRLCQRSEPLRRTYDLVQRFGQMVRQRQVENLAEWLKEAGESEVAELRRFAAGLERDRAAVEAGLRLEWSNGPVEGQVQRLKTVKRQMYGRAKFDLLRRRVLHAA
jgi:transposase